MTFLIGLIIGVFATCFTVVILALNAAKNIGPIQDPYCSHDYYEWVSQPRNVWPEKINYN